MFIIQSIFDSYKAELIKGKTSNKAIEYLESKLGQLPDDIKDRLRSEK